MKKRYFNLCKLVICSLVLWAACTKGGVLSEITGDAYILSGKGDSKQLVPAIDSAATGNLTGWYDKQLQTITATVKWSNLWVNTKDTLKTISLYGPAAAGANGPLISTIALLSYNASGSMEISLAGSKMLTADNLGNLVAGKCYYTLCTQHFPSGIVRGQINAELMDPNKVYPNFVTDISFRSTNKTLLQVGDTTTLLADVLPSYATNKAITWESSNAAVVSVDQSGKIKALANGYAIVAAKSKDGSNITGSQLVVVNLQLIDYGRAGWTVTCSDEKASDGGGKDMILDGNFTTYWHSQWSPDIALPHWLRIDMQTARDVASIKIYRRSANTDTKTVIVETSLDGTSFTAAGVLNNFDANSMASVTFRPVNARYLKLTVTESNRPPYANVVEMNVGMYQ
jgi:hypothetical protein